jgi:uncharacterized membrane protein YuzA (DUF378 family)
MFPGPLLQLIFALLVVMVALWVLAAIPGDSTIKAIIRAIIIGVCAIWALVVLYAWLSSMTVFHGR